MSDIVDLAAFRQRRAWDRLAEAVQFGQPMPMTSEQQRELDEIWAGLEPDFIVYDEVHLWTEYNALWDQLSASSGPTSLRILHSTDQGSDDGYAEGDGGDPPPAC